MLNSIPLFCCNFLTLKLHEAYSLLQHWGIPAIAIGVPVVAMGAAFPVISPSELHVIHDFHTGILL